jgi:hypothetical protein
MEDMAVRFHPRNEDGVIVNFNNLVPRDEFIRAAHAMFDIEPYSLRKRLHELKNQISELPNFPVEISGANPAFEQAREVNQSVVLVERGCPNCWFKECAQPNTSPNAQELASEMQIAPSNPASNRPIAISVPIIRSLGMM